ncbi:hypothetical protein IEQ34_005867 [Dendrobium chrysotoxum]|uniref:C2H2-type domain-containing protein n=1 Tax=Dendrobium chrysotoxum TaxID=161865 RepID=A0AAV7GW91_DENCH|nr:hypothetical protein IEQ34_005867 [Dendrobium chrysotoxum]
MPFLSIKALFGRLRIHHKSNKRAQETSRLPLRQSKLSNDFIATYILMGIRRSKMENDIYDAKLSKLRWVCAKIERQRKNMKEVTQNQSVNYYQRKICKKVPPSLLALAGQSVSQWNRSNSNKELNYSAARSVEMEIHQCDKCDKALCGHKRAHYIGPRLNRLESNVRSQAALSMAAAVGEAVVHDFDLNRLVEERIRCSECSMSFLSPKALFGHLRIHRKCTNVARKASLLPLRQAKLSEDFIAACILMEMKRSKLEADIDDAKRSKLRWVCTKINKQRKSMKEVVSNQSVKYYQRKIYQKVTPSLLALAGQSVGKWNKENSNDEMSVGVVCSTEMEIHQCDKCDKVFNSGQALGGHKRAHYTGPPLCRPGSNARSQATLAAVAATEVIFHDFDLNEPME